MATSNSPFIAPHPEAGLARNKRRGRKLRVFLLAITIATLAFAVFSIFASTVGTTGDSPYPTSFLLTWITLPSFVLGLAYMGLYFLVRRHQAR